MTGTNSDETMPTRRRFSLPSLPTARYKLSRLFFNFYLLTMGAFIAIAVVADFIIRTPLRDMSDDYTRHLMQGTVSMIEDDLFRHRRADWAKRMETLSERFDYHLAISNRNEIVLPREQEIMLDAGELAISKDGAIVYRRIKNTAQILVIGPLSPDIDPNNRRIFTLEMRVRFLFWGLISFFLAIAVWLWVRPVWRDLEALRQTARAFGEGDFAARAPAVNNASFELLAQALNAMAERVQRLIATQKELSSAISHELRTPIARMRFALEMAADTEDPAERTRLAQMMEGDLDELDNLIDSSLTYARFERDQPDLQPIATKIEAWLGEKVDDMRILAGKLAIDVDTSALPVETEVDLDRRIMPFAIRNLLRNAIKYAHTRIVVNAELTELPLSNSVGQQHPAQIRRLQQICIHFDDDGIGVPEDERDNVFTAFARLDRSRDRATGGYGLGLAITRLVLEMHGGTATVTASPLGGARFTLAWPIHTGRKA